MEGSFLIGRRWRAEPLWIADGLQMKFYLCPARPDMKE
jgi:hypothetical protein